MKRRTYLRSTVVGATGVALAGCIGGSDPEIEITQVALSNSDGQERTVELEIEFDGDTIHDGSHDLSASEGPDDDGGSAVVDDLPDEEGEYEIEATLAGGDLDAHTSTPAEDTEADCLAIEIEVLPGPNWGQHNDEC